MHDLTPENMALLAHLRREVDHYQEQDLKTGIKHPNIKQDLDRSRRELKSFVLSLREAGHNI